MFGQDVLIGAVRNGKLKGFPSHIFIKKISLTHNYLIIVGVRPLDFLIFLFKLGLIFFTSLSDMHCRHDMC